MIMMSTFERLLPGLRERWGDDEIAGSARGALSISKSDGYVDHRIERPAFCLVNGGWRSECSHACLQNLDVAGEFVGAVLPGSNAGASLKPGARHQRQPGGGVLPGSNAGASLKPGKPSAFSTWPRVLPGSNAGASLKQQEGDPRRRRR